MATFSIVPARAQSVTAEANSNDCVTDYQPDADYFPDKIEIEDATDFSVEYFHNYKVVIVADAFPGATPFEYVLTQCGTPAPDQADFPAETQFIDVPAKSVIALSNTELPHLAELGQLDRLVGVDSFQYVNAPDVLRLIDGGKLAEVGSGAQVNVERVLELAPDLVMTFGYNPTTDAHPLLIKAGVFTALNAEWREATPLGRAEWIKYTSLFFNAEARASAVYGQIATSYHEAQQLAASVPADQQPTVLWNVLSPTVDSWTIPGADTYAAQFILDAGGKIALGDQAPTESVKLSFETVYDQALDADFWITNAFGVNALDDLLAQDKRYADFAAVKNGKVWNNTLDVNTNGGNNYWELGVTNPHLILRDLVAILHPDLLPGHQFVFYRPLTASTPQAAP